jgi:hypothetical protein
MEIFGDGNLSRGIFGGKFSQIRFEVRSDNNMCDLGEGCTANGHLISFTKCYFKNVSLNWDLIEDNRAVWPLVL